MGNASELTKPQKPCLAYVVTEGYDQAAVIVFASSGIAARRYGANELDVEFNHVDSCRRAKWADQYGKTCEVPAKAWIDNGFSHTCNYCGNNVFGDVTEDESGNPQEPVYADMDVYCGPSCKEGRETDDAKRRASGEAFSARIRAERPYLEITKENNFYPSIYNSAEFMFEGGKHPGCVSEEKDGSLRWRICAIDQEAYAAFEAKRLGAAS